MPYIEATIFEFDFDSGNFPTLVEISKPVGFDLKRKEEKYIFCKFAIFEATIFFYSDSYKRSRLKFRSGKKKFDTKVNFFFFKIDFFSSGRQRPDLPTKFYKSLGNFRNRAQIKVQHAPIYSV